MTNTLEITEAMAATLQVPLSEAETIEIVTAEPLGPFAPPAASYLINEGFEGTGAPGDWLGFGAANFDYTAAALVGAQSLRLPSDNDSAQYSDGVLDHAALWIQFRIKFESLPLTPPTFGFFEPSTSSPYASIRLNTDGTITVTDGAESVSATTVGAVVAGNIYDFWIHLITGTGSDAVIEFAFADAGDPIPTSGDRFASVDSATITGNFTTLFFYPASAYSMVLDSVQVWLPPPTPATAYSLAGPANGIIGVASSDFTVALIGNTVTGTVTVTPDDGSDGTFTPASVELTTASPSATFTYTPVSIGAKTISTTNDGELDDPGSLTYTVAASGLSDGDPVTTWEDSSGNGNDATMTGSNRPTFKTAIVNDKPVVRFTSAGSSKLNLTTPISGALPWMIFVVMKPANPALGDVFPLVSSSVLPIGLWANQNASPPTIGGGAGNFYTIVNTVPSGFGVFTGNALADLIYINGTVQSRSFVASVTPGNFENLGWRSNATQYSDGDIAEIIIYAATLSGTDRQNIEKYLGTKYGVTVAGGSAVQPDTVSGLQGWWKADSLG